MPTTDRVLIIEQEALLALEIQDVLTDHGFAEVHHHRSVAEAAPHFEDLAAFRLAIVEARLGAAEVVAFTERLVQAGVATVVMSADRTATELFPHAAALGKPFDAAGLLAACSAAGARLT
jgi:DNA-binding response OmpR family regulator